MVTTEQKRADIQAAIEARDAEIWGYDLNILNYAKMIKLIKDDPEFMAEIEQRLKAEQLQRGRSVIVLESLRAVLTEM